MNAANKPQASKKPEPSLSDSEPLGPMMLSGIVRTGNGFAVAVAEVSGGKLTKLKLGKSQTYLEFVAVEHKGTLGQLARQVQFGKLGGK